MVDGGRSTIAHARAGNPRSPPKPKHGWCCWPAGRRRTLAIRTNCGRRDFSPATPASLDQRRGTRASTNWPRVGVQDPRRAGGEAAQGALLLGTPRPRVRREDGGGLVRLLPRETPEADGGRLEAQAERCRSDHSYDEKPGIQAIATTSPDLPPEPGKQSPASMRPSHAVMSTSAAVRSACWRASIFSPEKPIPWSRIATAAASSSRRRLLLETRPLRSSHPRRIQTGTERSHHGRHG
jgi:hypothetical protein